MMGVFTETMEPHFEICKELLTHVESLDPREVTPRDGAGHGRVHYR